MATLDAAPPVQALLFDAFGTLLDTHSAMRRLAGRIGAGWEQASRDWRGRTLEYTWVRTLAGAEYRPFAELSEEALAAVAPRHGLHDPALRAAILEEGRRLDPHPDAAPALAALRALPVRCAVLSNGETAGLAEQMRAAGLAEGFEALLGVQDIGVFKPHRRVYELGTAWAGLPAERIGFVSANAWDAFAAHRFGYRVFRIDRDGGGDEYGLAGTVAVLRHLGGLPDLVR